MTLMLSGTASELLKRADVAMYEAKDLGRNRVCLFSKKQQAAVNRKTAMARAMSMTVVAEGVETERQEHFLLQEGCDMMQGYRYARPLPMTDFITYLEENTRPPSNGTRPSLFVLNAGNNG